MSSDYDDYTESESDFPSYNSSGCGPNCSCGGWVENSSASSSESSEFNTDSSSSSEKNNHLEKEVFDKSKKDTFQKNNHVKNIQEFVVDKVIGYLHERDEYINSLLEEIKQLKQFAHCCINKENNIIDNDCLKYMKRSDYRNVCKGCEGKMCNSCLVKSTQCTLCSSVFCIQCSSNFIYMCSHCIVNLCSACCFRHIPSYCKIKTEHNNMFPKLNEVHNSVGNNVDNVDENVDEFNVECDTNHISLYDNEHGRCSECHQYKCHECHENLNFVCMLAEDFKRI